MCHLLFPETRVFFWAKVNNWKVCKLYQSLILHPPVTKMGTKPKENRTQHISTVCNFLLFEKTLALKVLSNQIDRSC